MRLWHQDSCWSVQCSCYHACCVSLVSQCCLAVTGLLLVRSRGRREPPLLVRARGGGAMPALPALLHQHSDNYAGFPLSWDGHDMFSEQCPSTSHSFGVTTACLWKRLSAVPTPRPTTPIPIPVHAVRCAISRPTPNCLLFFTVIGLGCGCYDTPQYVPWYVLACRACTYIPFP